MHSTQYSNSTSAVLDNSTKEAEVRFQEIQGGEESRNRKGGGGSKKRKGGRLYVACVCHVKIPGGGVRL